MELMGIDEILGDIVGFGGVACAFVCDPEGKVLAARPERQARSPAIAEVGRATMQAFLCLSTLGESTDELDLSFEKGRVVVRSAGPLASLAVVCQPSINALMLRLRTAMAVAAIALEMEAARREESSPHFEMRVRDTLEAALGEKAGKFLALVSAAGESPEKLAAAGSEAVRFAKLFFGKDKAEALQSQLRSVLGREI
jgi:predicted regulator of Ras-like GTPase activity (Roadblock/LC7/MglB family)